MRGGNPDARKQRGQKEHDMVLGQWGNRAGKAGEWKEIRLHRMELYYVSSRKFSLLKRIFHLMGMEMGNCKFLSKGENNGWGLRENFHGFRVGG